MVTASTMTFPASAGISTRCSGGQRYDTDETGMLIEDAAQTAERLGGLRRCDDSLLQLCRCAERWKSERIRDVQLPD